MKKSTVFRLETLLALAVLAILVWSLVLGCSDEGLEVSEHVFFADGDAGVTTFQD